MRRYEQVYILRPSLSEDAITTVIENTNQLILDDNGAIIYQNKWGMRKLAYQIKKEVQGYYVLCDFAATPVVVSEIERKFRIDDAVLKYLTVKVADSISVDEIEAARSEAEANAIVPEVEETPEEEPAKPAPAKSAPTKPAPAKPAPAKPAPAKQEAAEAEEKTDDAAEETEKAAEADKPTESAQ